MAFKDILLALTSYPAATPDASIDRAVALAAALGAHVTALTFEADVPPRGTRNLLANLILNLPELVAEEHATSLANAKSLLAAFKASASKQGVAHNAMLAKSIALQVPDRLVQHARLHDLTILPLQDGYSVEAWYAEAVIFGSGRPTILLPGPAKTAPPPGTVTVAWDFSRASARALADAMPLLEAAKMVRVVTITGDKEMAGSHAELAQNLQRHGIAAEMEMVAGNGRSADKVLCEYIASTKSSLLVMGAYGHSRAREFILGGVTRGLLEDPPVPIFLSHG
jgi:nucleotide-binding universal stress UspA family protein